ncbi:hypothetical protein GCM10027033_20410 [Leucobacter ruminantium]
MLRRRRSAGGATSKVYIQVMDRAKHEPTGAELWATDLKRMDSSDRERIWERLACVCSDGAAYYVPPTKRGLLRCPT